MKFVIVLFTILTTTLAIQAQESTPIYDPLKLKKGSSNEYFKVRRNDSRILSEKMGPGDTAEIFICFNRYLTIKLDETFVEDINSVSKYNELIDSQISPSKKSIQVQLKSPVKLMKNRIKITSGVRVELDNATKDSYNFEIVGTDCKGADSYPIEITIGKKMIGNYNSQMLHPRNFIIENTYNYEITGEYYRPNYDAFAASSEEDYVSLSISVNINSDKSKDLKNRNIEFKAFDALEFNLLPVKYKVLPYVTEYETKKSKMPTWAFDFRLFVGKKYIKERGYFYLYMIDHDHKTYTKTLINLKEGYKKFKATGAEI